MSKVRESGQSVEKGIVKNEREYIFSVKENPSHLRPWVSNGQDREPLERWVVKLDFVGANSEVKPAGLEKREAVISYFKGKPEEWKTGLPTYSKLIYRELWPGIDLVYSGTVNRLKYEFIVHPGGDPSQIRLAYRGVESIGITEEGRLKLVTPAGEFEDDVPVAWQDDEGKRVDVALSYELEDEPLGGILRVKGSGEAMRQSTDEEDGLSVFVYSFQVGAYDRSKALILDPAVFIYCGYIGGLDNDRGHGIAVDSSGNAYVTGVTKSFHSKFPVTIGPDLTHNGGEDAFVAKISELFLYYVFDGHDFDGNGTSDIGVWRPSDGMWYIKDITTQQWGISYDIPCNGDYNGDGITDIAVWRPTEGMWYLKNIGAYQWGTSGDIPVPGKYNADVITDIAIWRPAIGIWYIYGIGALQWGTLGDIPLVR